MLEVVLYTVLVILIFLVIALAVVFVMVRKKENTQVHNETVDGEITNDSSQNVKGTSTTKIAKEYETKSIFDFMEFENIKDNMIIQKGGKRFLMAIECKGINYDLMSEVEKAATEEGFATFLNTLREPIQLYIQTRTVNLERNLLNYQERIERIRESLNLKEYRLKEYMERGNNNEKILKNKQFEVLREKNLYSYGQDIVADTRKMSLNKNVLKKKYYVIIKYFYESIDDGEEKSVTEEEIREIAFSNLYTKAASIINVLSGIGIVGKTLNSFELVELIYNAYNRDDSEIFGIDKAIEAGYNEIYVDSQSIIDKKIEALNREIEMRAQEKAQNALKQVLDERNEELKELEDNIENIIDDLAKKAIESEQNNIPLEIREKAIEKIDKENNKKGEDKADGEPKTKETNRKRRAS